MATRFFGASPPQPGRDTDASSLPSPGAPTAPANAPEHRRALLVGNARYTQGKLANPVNDVRLIGNVLRALGFAVTIVEDADKAALQASVIAFCIELEKAGPGAVALFYFAGHGIQHHGSNFLLPIGADIPSTRYLPALAMSADEIVVELTRTRRKANVIVLDACRNNALPGLAAESRDIMQGLAALRLPPDGVLVAYSTAAGAVAEDGEGKCSPYAEALAQALPSLLGAGKRLHDVFIEAAERVKEVTHARQAPALYLQGTLPPLAVDEADRERFRTFVFYEPAWPWRRILKHAAAGLAGVAAATLIVAWFTAYPETRALWLHKAGIAPNESYDFSCEPPWDKPDRFGLTRADWCARFLGDLVIAVKASGRWDELVAQAIDRGDPKAMALRASELWGTYGYPARGSPERAQMVELALRAGRSGLATAWIELERATQSNQTARDAVTAAEASIEAEAKRAVIAAADAGVAAAQHIVALGAIQEGDVDKAVAWISRADETDPYGNAAFALGNAFTGRSGPRFPRDLVQARRWLMTAANKGNSRAYAALVNLAGDNQIVLSPADEAQISDRIIARGGPDGAYFKGRRLLEPGPRQDVAEAIKQLSAAAEGGNEPAMLMLGLYYKRTPSVSDPDRALHWMQRAVATGNAEALIHLGGAFVDGMADIDGKPRMTPAPDKAREAFLTALEVGDTRAALYIGDLYETGALGKREPGLARRYFERVLSEGGERRRMIQAEDALRRLDVDAYVATPDALPEIARGDPKAMVTVTIYMPLGCDECAAAYRQLVAPLIERFVAPGAVRLIFRESFPTESSAARDDASLLIRCAPAGQRWDIVERFIAQFEEWSMIADRVRRLDQLERLAAPVRMDADAQEVCMGNGGWRAALRERYPALIQRFRIQSGMPLMIVNGDVLVRPAPGQLERAIMLALSPQTRATILSAPTHLPAIAPTRAP